MTFYVLNIALKPPTLAWKSVFLLRKKPGLHRKTA